MPSKLLFVLAASSGVLGSGQFLRSFSSSWTSSSAWVPGRDGQMHQQVHEVRTETFRDHGVAVKRTESETACRDGLCQKTLSVQKPGSITVVSQEAPAGHSGWADSVRVPPRLRAMLRGLPFPAVRVAERVTPVSIAFLAPRPQTAVHEPRPLGEAVPSIVPKPDNVVPVAALAGASMTLVVLIAAALGKCHRAQSREVPLQTLGEPLAPAQEPAAAACRAPRQAKPAPAPAAPKEAEAAAEGAPVGAYLRSLYERAVVAAETAAIKAYVCKVYERASA